LLRASVISSYYYCLFFHFSAYTNKKQQAAATDQKMAFRRHFQYSHLLFTSAAIITLMIMLSTTSCFSVLAFTSSSVGRTTTERYLLLENNNEHISSLDQKQQIEGSSSTPESSETSRRTFFSSFLATNAALAAAAGAVSGGSLSPPPSANAIGPVKVPLTPTGYVAAPCPKSKPMPGQMAMRGMRALCVTVDATIDEPSPKPLDKVGVYGIITDKGTGDSVLANNPDLSTDAGQFAMVEAVQPQDRKLQFEFIAAVPMETDLSQFENGIGPLNFKGLRLVSFPGGQQYGAISPCEMNEFSEECEAWEEENGPYKKAEFMVKSNSRTKGR